MGKGINMNNYTKDNRRGGFYWVEGKPFVSVTKVLDVLDKPPLRYWYGQMVYYAMIKNPSLGEKEALAAPYQVSDVAKNRGTTVHSIVEAWKTTEGHIDTIPEAFRGYAQAFYDWTIENHITLKEHERTVISKKHGYAGTLDLLVGVNGSGKTWLIDIKTGKDIYPEAFLQLSAYKQALSEEGIEVDEIAVLLLRENGKYKFEKGEYAIETFLQAKGLWEWRNKELIAKVN